MKNNCPNFPQQSAAAFKLAFNSIYGKFGRKPSYDNFDFETLFQKGKKKMITEETLYQKKRPTPKTLTEAKQQLKTLDEVLSKLDQQCDEKTKSISELQTENFNFKTLNRRYERVIDKLVTGDWN